MPGILIDARDVTVNTSDMVPASTRVCVAARPERK